MGGSRLHGLGSTGPESRIPVRGGCRISSHTLGMGFQRGWSWRPLGDGWFRNRRGEFDDGAAAHASTGWCRVPWSAYNDMVGDTHPCQGDLDGDGLAELVVGLDILSQGWMAIFDDQDAGRPLLRWLQVPWALYNQYVGRTWPALGDIDGDLRDEIVVGLGPFACNGGWFCAFEDAASGYGLMGWKQLPWSQYNSASGELRPACAELDGDGREELVFGLARTAVSQGWIAVMDDWHSGAGLLRWLNESNTACGLAGRLAFLLILSGGLASTLDDFALHLPVSPALASKVASRSSRTRRWAIAASSPGSASGR